MFLFNVNRKSPNITIETKSNLHTLVTPAVKQIIFDGLQNVFTSKIDVQGSVIDGLPQFICITASDR